MRYAAITSPATAAAVVACWAVAFLLGSSAAAADDPAATPAKGRDTSAVSAEDVRSQPTLEFNTRSRKQIAPAGVWEVVEEPVKWDARQTALIIIDVWDKHWCAGANRRVAPMVGRMNELTKAMRDKGALIAHAPSDTMKTYEGTPQRKLAQEAPAAKSDAEFKWNYIDPTAEGKLPIDDSDGGCDCEPQCKSGIVWKGQHPGIDVKAGDAVSDNGREVFNLIEQRGIQNVLIFGVHTNMCVLGRSFGIRQMKRLGKNVLLVRDLTDTMYNPRMAPFVAHDKGTDLVVEHVERHWCPTVLSADVLGGHRDPRVVFVMAEDEYGAKDTVPAFAEADLKERFACDFLYGGEKSSVDNLDRLDPAKADLLVMFMRRRTLPPEQLARFRDWFDAGKPVVAVRTSSHAFQNWLEFDKLVLGGNYHGHHGNEGEVHVSVAEGAAGHPILRGVGPFGSRSSLYKASPLAETTTTLLTGVWKDQPAEPVAWTNTYKGGRIFYTSLGGRDDFNDPNFRRLLNNGILWALDKPIPKAD